MAKQNSPTQRDMITGLYTEVLGINGKGGMRQDIADVKDSGIRGRDKLHKKIEEAEVALKQAQEKKDYFLRHFRAYWKEAVEPNQAPTPNSE